MNDTQTRPPPTLAWKCRRCGGTLLKHTAGALLARDAAIEVKCGRCNTFNYLSNVAES